MISFRQSHPSIGTGRYWRGDVSWYGVGPQADVGNGSHSIAFGLRGGSQEDDDIYAMVNAYWEDLDFRVQEAGRGLWRRVVDTSLDSPHDFWGLAVKGRCKPRTTGSLRARL